LISSRREISELNVEGAEYSAICLPAFSLETMHRDDPSSGAGSSAVQDNVGRMMKA